MKKTKRGAGLMPAALAEIRRIRAEWAVLKEFNLLETPDSGHTRVSPTSVNTTVKKTRKLRRRSDNLVCKQTHNRLVESTPMGSDVLVGVVALVEVGTEERALPLRAALTALGASVVPHWQTIVTHLVWCEGGDPEVRRKARAYAARVVSPVWVEACASTNKWLPERAFPSVIRASDLPSPRQLIQLLLKAERENETLNFEASAAAKRKRSAIAVIVKSGMNSETSAKRNGDGDAVPADDKVEKPTIDGVKTPATREEKHDSTEGTEGDTSAASSSAETTDNTTIEKEPLPATAGPSDRPVDDSEKYGAKPKIKPPPKQKKKRRDKTGGGDRPTSRTIRTSSGVDNRVNTAPRRAQPVSVSPEATPETEQPRRVQPQRQSQNKQDKAEPGTSSGLPPRAGPSKAPPQAVLGQARPRGRPRLVAPRRVDDADETQPELRTLRSRRKLFTQREPAEEESTDSDEEASGSSQQRERHNMSHRERQRLARAERLARRFVNPSPASSPPRSGLRSGRLRIVLTGMSREERLKVAEACQTLGAKIQSTVNRKTTHVLLGCFGSPMNEISGVMDISDVNVSAGSGPRRASARLRTLNALAGAARGCRVLRAQWALDSARAGSWRHHYHYQVPHLKNMAERAHAERHAFGLSRAHYGYDVFSGKRVRVSESCEQAVAATHLLALCGAVVYDQQGNLVKDADILRRQVNDPGYHSGQDVDVTLGTQPGDVTALWVFDSVAAGRMRNVRRYKVRAAADG